MELKRRGLEKIKLFYSRKMSGIRKGGKTGGRQAGVPNLVTKELKDMILEALSNVGGTTYLQTQARDNPGQFMTLLGKVLPLQVTGKDGGALVVSWEK